MANVFLGIEGTQRGTVAQTAREHMGPMSFQFSMGIFVRVDHEFVDHRQQFQNITREFFYRHLYSMILPMPFPRWRLSSFSAGNG